METLEAILAKNPFFGGLDPSYIKLLAGCASNARYDRDEYLFRADEEAREFYIIRHGTVAIEAIVPGAAKVIVQTYEAGDVVGWSWLFPPYHWYFSGRAVELTRVLVLDGVCLRNKCEQNTSLGYEFMKRFSHKMIRSLDLTRLQLLDVAS